jgi:serine/threonine protein kinase
MQVYLGMWQHTHVAVKFLVDQSEEQQAAFRREAELLRSLRHPNIVTFLGCCMQPGKVSN